MRMTGAPALLVSALRWLARGVLGFGLVWGPGAAAFAAPPPLVIGRVDTPSLVADISEQVLREAFRRLGVGIEFKRLPLPRAVEAANDGDIDGDANRIGDAVRRYRNLIVVPTPINQVEVAIYGATPAVAALTRADIGKLRVGIARGTLVLSKYSQGMAVTDVQSMAGISQMVLSGRVDVAMAIYLDTEERIREGRAAQIYLWPHLWAAEPLYFVLHKRHADLVAPLNDVLLLMQREGLIEQYYRDGLQRSGVRPLSSEQASSGSAPEPR